MDLNVRSGSQRVDSTQGDRETTVGCLNKLNSQLIRPEGECFADSIFLLFCNRVENRSHTVKAIVCTEVVVDGSDARKIISTEVRVDVIFHLLRNNSLRWIIAGSGKIQIMNFGINGRTQQQACQRNICRANCSQIGCGIERAAHSEQSHWGIIDRPIANQSPPITAWFQSCLDQR